MYKFLSLRMLNKCSLKSCYINNKLYQIELISSDRVVLKVFNTWKECYKHLKLRKWLFEGNNLL
jgi:hypothetical protein